MRRERGATLIEAAFVVPLVLLLIFGMIEFGRYVSITSTVTNASREAARYGSAVGPGSGTDPRYSDCDGMRDAAQALAVLGRPEDADISLNFDNGPGTSVYLTCNGVPSIDPADVTDGDRIVVVVSAPYDTIVPLVGIFLGPDTVTAETVRTINKGSA